MTQDNFAVAFTKWDQDYRDNPEHFNEDWHATGTAETYGERAAAYFIKLLGEIENGTEEKES